MTASPRQPQTDYVRRHLRFGWWALFVFLLLGATLETLHGFKAGFYLDVSNETRRLMWTLAHAHGALLGIVNVAAGLSLRALPGPCQATDGLFCSRSRSSRPRCCCLPGSSRAASSSTAATPASASRWCRSVRRALQSPCS